MPRREYKDHFVIYYDKNKRSFITTTSKDWARRYRTYFPNKTFKSARTTPTSEEIGRVLKDQFSFVEFTHSEVVVLCNFDTMREDF